MPEIPLTCEQCRAEPVTHLQIYDVGAPGCKAPVRVKRMVGDACAARNGGRSSQVAVTAPSARLFALVPVMEMAR